MFTISLILFAAVLVVLVAATTRGFFRLDEIVEVVDSREQDAASSHALNPAER